MTLFSPFWDAYAPCIGVPQGDRVQPPNLKLLDILAMWRLIPNMCNWWKLVFTRFEGRFFAESAKAGWKEVTREMKYPTETKSLDDRSDSTRVGWGCMWAKIEMSLCASCMGNCHSLARNSCPVRFKTFHPNQLCFPQLPPRRLHHTHIALPQFLSPRWAHRSQMAYSIGSCHHGTIETIRVEHGLGGVNGDFFFHQNCLGHRGCLEKRYVKKLESSIRRLVPSWTKRSTSTAYRQTFHQLNKKQILSHPLTYRMSSSDPVALQAKKSSESIRLPCQLAPTSWRRRYRYHFLSLWNSIYPLLRLDFWFPWKNSTTSDPAASMITSTYGSMIKACLEHQGSALPTLTQNKGEWEWSGCSKFLNRYFQGVGRRWGHVVHTKIPQTSDSWGKSNSFFATKEGHQENESRDQSPPSWWEWTYLNLQELGFSLSRSFCSAIHGQSVSAPTASVLMIDVSEFLWYHDHLLK